MEKTGVIAGYTVVLGDAEPKSHIDALISISVAPADRQYFITMVENQPGVAQCFHVTGSQLYCEGELRGHPRAGASYQPFSEAGADEHPDHFIRAGGPALYFGCA